MEDQSTIMQEDIGLVFENEFLFFKKSKKYEFGNRIEQIYKKNRNKEESEEELNVWSIQVMLRKFKRNCLIN